MRHQCLEQATPLAFMDGAGGGGIKLTSLVALLKAVVSATSGTLCSFYAWGASSDPSFGVHWVPQSQPLRLGPVRPYCKVDGTGQRRFFRSLQKLERDGAMVLLQSPPGVICHLQTMTAAWK